VREEVIDEAIRAAYERLRFSEDEELYLEAELSGLTSQWRRYAEESRTEARLRIGRIQARLERLTDAYLDGTLEQDLFESKKRSLLEKKKELEESQAKAADGGAYFAEVREVLELANSALQSYETADQEEKRDLLRITTSNFTANGEYGFVELRQPFLTISDRHSVPSSVQALTNPRSLRSLPSAEGNHTDRRREYLGDMFMQLLGYIKTHPGTSAKTV
jgi:hypothetical protein